MADLGDLLGTLDLPAKVRLLTGASFFGLQGDADLGLAPVALSDGPTGVKGLSRDGAGVAAAEREHAGEHVGRVAAARGRRTARGRGGPAGRRRRPRADDQPAPQPARRPAVRVLLGGSAAHRPAGRGAGPGAAGPGVGACLKHLVGNEAETERHTVDVRIDEATLREVYLLPFEIAVADANPWMLMAAYNRVNGVPATEQDAVINGVVKGEWSYDGVVVSDWFATTSTAPAITGGLDLVMPGPMGPWGDALVRAVEDGEVPEAIVDDAVRRLLRLAERTGALGGQPGTRTDVPEPTDPGRRARPAAVRRRRA